MYKYPYIILRFRIDEFTSTLPKRVRTLPSFEPDLHDRSFISCCRSVSSKRHIMGTGHWVTAEVDEVRAMYIFVYADSEPGQHLTMNQEKNPTNHKVRSNSHVVGRGVICLVFVAMSIRCCVDATCDISCTIITNQHHQPSSTMFT